MSHPVKTHPIRTPEDIPETVENFRGIIADFKHNVFSNLESSKSRGKKSAQQEETFNDAIHRVITFGKILMNALETKTAPASIAEMFQKNSISLSNMTREENELCKYYIHIDIHAHTFDINGHASQNK